MRTVAFSVIPPDLYYESFLIDDVLVVYCRSRIQQLRLVKQIMLLDKYIGIFQYNELHKTDIRANPKDIYSIINSVNFYRSKLIKLLFTMRGLPIQICSLEGFIKIGFILLEENTEEEIVIGAIFHPLKFRPIRVSTDEFREFNEKDHVKAVMNFYITKIDEKRSLLSTESRVFCTSRKAKLIFTPYWLLIRRFSGLIRIEMLRLIKKDAEQMSGEVS